VRLAAFVVFAVMLIAALASATVYWTSTRHHSDISENTVFEGTMQAVSEVKVTVLEAGVVSDINVHAGDTVREGDVLVKMDSRDAELAVQRAEIAFEASQRNLAHLRGELAETEAELSAAARAAALVPSRQVRDSIGHTQAVYDQVSVDYQRNEQLYKDGIIAKQVLDSSATQLRIAQDDLANAKKGDLATQDVKPLQERQGALLSRISQQEQEQQVREARLAFQLASERLANTSIRATSSGVIAAVAVKIGDQVAVGAPLVTIARIDRITVNVPVAASLIGTLHKWQEARVTIPTTPPQALLGTIRAISPVPSANMTHNVEVEFDNPTGTLLIGQPAEVRFVLE
jgi:membrane fusion protein (multidrug efflux system)